MRVFLVLALTLSFTSVVTAQGNAKLFQVPKTEDKMLAPDDNESIIRYENVADRSILWSKIVLEKVDLEADANKVLYYPVDTLRTHCLKRLSQDAFALTQILISKNQGDSRICCPLSRKEILLRLVLNC